MSDRYKAIENLEATAVFADDGIVTQKLYASDRAKHVLFSMDDGQELSEHTATCPASFVILKGRALVTLGEDSREVGPGFFVHMEPNLPHSVVARGRVIFLLSMFRNPVAPPG